MAKRRKTTRSKRASKPISKRGARSQVTVRRPSDAESGLAPGMQTVSPYLAVANVGASVEFLERAFGFSRGVVIPDGDGQWRYAEMHHGRATIVLVRKGDATTATNGAAALYAYVEDVDGMLSRARQAGAGVESAEDKPWGDRVGTVTDPDGYRWVLATFKKLAPFS